MRALWRQCHAVPGLLGGTHTHTSESRQIRCLHMYVATFLISSLRRFSGAHAHGSAGTRMEGLVQGARTKQVVTGIQAGS